MSSSIGEKYHEENKIVAIAVHFNGDEMVDAD